LRALGWLTEAGVGACLGMVPSPFCVTQIGGALLVGHGLDNYQAGYNQAISNQPRDPITIQILQKSGMSHNAAHMANDLGMMIGTMGGAAVLRAASATGVLPLKPICKSNVVEGYAEAPWGRKGNPFENSSFQPYRNSSTMIEGRPYAEHALDQMQNRGITPSVIEGAINNGISLPNKVSGRMQFYDSINNISVITEEGGVVTVFYGKIR